MIDRILRFEGDQQRPLVPKSRKLSSDPDDTVRARGMFPDATIAIGADWCYHDQDRLTSAKGKLKKLTAWHEHLPRSAGIVEWKSTGVKNIYRLGYEGKVDLKCAKAADGPTLYRCHLPKMADVIQAVIVTGYRPPRRNGGK